VETLLLSPITIGLGSLFVIGCIILLIWVFRGSGKPKVYLSMVENVLTPAEQSFYEQLDAVIDGRLEILCKVRLADLLEIESKNADERNRLFRRISSKHVDFVLTEPGQLVPRLVIELDDSSHESKERRERDEFLDELFETVRFPLLRIKATTTYSRRALVEALEEALGVRR
jgi:very-short-patch-repair endonuclease